MEFSFGSLLSIAGKVWDVVRDRPNVRILPRLADYGAPTRGVVTWRVGLIVDVEVHSTGRQPVEVREVGLELEGGRRLSFPTTSKALPVILDRPEHMTASLDLEPIRKGVRTARAVAFYVSASPDRTFRLPLRNAWERFPHDLPPAVPGREPPGFFFGSMKR